MRDHGFSSSILRDLNYLKQIAGSNPAPRTFFGYSLNYLAEVIFLFMIEMVFSFFDNLCQKNTTTLYNILCNNMYD
jgi:hypothetical protein